MSASIEAAVTLTMTIMPIKIEKKKKMTLPTGITLSDLSMHQCCSHKWLASQTLLLCDYNTSTVCD